MHLNLSKVSYEAAPTAPGEFPRVLCPVCSKPFYRNMIGVHIGLAASWERRRKDGLSSTAHLLWKEQMTQIEKGETK